MDHQDQEIQMNIALQFDDQEYDTAEIKAVDMNPRATSRKCTDVALCGIFVGLLVWVLFIFTYSTIRGDLSKLTAGLDHANNLCGQPHKNALLDFSKYPYVYMNPATILINPQQAYRERVCVKKCPENGEKPACPLLINLPYQKLCNKIPASQDTQIFWDSYCLPNEWTHLRNILPLFNRNYTGYFAYDLSKFWWAILTGALVSVGLAIGFFYLIGIMKVWFYWMVIGFSLAGIGFFGWLFMENALDLWNKYDDFKENPHLKWMNEGDLQAFDTKAQVHMV
jgi:hypothetical protein